MFVPQGQQSFRNSKADVKIFYGSGTTQTNTYAQSWIKPVGASHVYMLLIGGGGAGDGSTSAGGSGSTSVWYGAAQHVPNALIVTPAPVGKLGTNGGASLISYRNGASSYTLIQTGGGSLLGGLAIAANAFSSTGFYQSVAGQDGQIPGNPAITGSATTFLGGGGYYAVASNYGYGSTDGTFIGPTNGFFMLQPIIVGLGGCTSASTTVLAGIGCGGGYGSVGGLGSPGGQGLILIASW